MKQKLKIGILIGQVVQIGGVCIAAFEEVRNLLQMGYQAELIVLMEKPEFRHDDFSKGIPLRYLSREYPKIFRKTFRIPGFSFLSAFHLFSPFLISRCIRPGTYDFIFAHETYNILSALSLWRKNRIPYGGYFWDPASYILPRVYQKRALGICLPILKPIVRHYDRKLIRGSQFSTVCSSYHLPFVRELAGKNNVKVLHPGCNITSEPIPKRRGNYLLALTKWDIGKNPEFLLKVLTRLKDKSVELVVAGNWSQGSLRQQFINQIRNYRLSDRVRLIDRVAGREKERLFAQARFLIHPIIEAFGMFVLEAAAGGCGSILPRGSGVNDLLEHGRSGYFPPEGDIDEYVRCLDQIVADERLAYSIGREARRVAERNTWRSHTEKLLSFIKQSGLNQ